MGDLRLALRGLGKSPVFTVVTLVSLALGIGATTAIFELIDALSLRPLEVERPEELGVVKIRNLNRFKGRRNGPLALLSYPMWERIRDRQEAFSRVAAFNTNCDANLAPTGVTHPVSGLCVSGGYYATLGVVPFLGRLLGPDDDQRGCTGQVAVVSHAFWQRELGGDRGAIGRKISLDGRGFEVIGVTPPGFGGPEAGRSFDVTTPMCLDAAHGADSYLGKSWWLSLAVVGRLKPGWTIERASAQLDGISAGIMEETVPPPPFYDADMTAAFRGYRLAAYPAAAGLSALREEYARPLDFLLGIAGLVLLIACANLANLLLARASTREREMAVRLAIGATRGRLARQLLSESLLLALLGAALGLLLASFLADLVIGLLPDPQMIVMDVGIDWRVFGFTAGLAVVTCLLFGLAPALRGARTDVGLVLKATAATTTDGPRRFGLRRLLVAVQVALSFVLVVGALLFVRSLEKLVGLHPGFRTAGVTRVSIELDSLGGGDRSRWAPVQDQVLARVRAIPGVETAAFSGIPQLEGSGWGTQVWADGAESTKAGSQLDRVGAGYFPTLDIPLLLGRDFGPGDAVGAPKVAVVNARFARTFFGDASPLGQRFRVSAGVRDAAPQAYEIIGVVADSKYRSLREELRPTAYFAAAQDPERGSSFDLYLRSRLGAAALSAAVERIALDASPAAVLSLVDLEKYRHDSLAGDRLMATVAGLFGVLAALLAAAGLYGVFAYSVARRGRELGIRMALGADGARVARLIFGEAAWLLALGLAAGVALALAGGRVATSLLYGLSPRDPLTFVAAGLSLAVLAALAVLPAALRAARVDPMKTLRGE